MGRKDYKEGIQEKIEEITQEDGTVKKFLHRFTINRMDTIDYPDGMMSCTTLSLEEIIE